MKRLDLSTVNQKLLELENKRFIKCLDEYTKAKDRHRFKCLVEDCGHIWSSSYNHVVNSGTGCPKCAKNFSDKEKGDKRLKDLVKKNILVLDDYHTSTGLYRCKCLFPSCDHTWKTSYGNLINSNNGCAKCAGQVVDKNERTNNLRDLSKRGILVLDEYKGVDKKHSCKCLVEDCGYTWQATYYNLVKNNSGCGKCAGNVVNTDEYSQNLRDLSKRGILVAEDYTQYHHKHTCRCMNCDHVWKARYHCLIDRKHGCPKCAGILPLTLEEQVVADARSSIRKRIDCCLRRTHKQSFSKFHDDELLAYCQREYLTILPKPKGFTLDHILPLKIFDPTDNLEMKLCWNRRNLRWITGVENSTKRDKIIFDLFDDWHYLVYNLVSSGGYDTELAKSLLD